MNSAQELGRLVAEIDLMDADLKRKQENISVARLALRQQDRMISYTAGQIAAYEAVVSVLKPAHRTIIHKRITALKEQMGDLDG